MSNTVSMPSNFDFSLFHRGADTTPCTETIKVDEMIKKSRRHTVKKQTLESLLYVKFGVEYD
jgi:hypothetical protein